MYDKLLPDEIKIDIFSRLPAKSIGRFRCLSKGWQDLLSHPYFIQTHLHLSLNHGQKGLLLKSSSPLALYTASLSEARHVFNEITIPSSRFHFEGITDSWYVVTSCCHGLLLVANGGINLSVVNPTTREITIVPPLPSDFQSQHGQDFKYGFGYDSVRDDYKVLVHVSHCSPPDEVEVTNMTFLYIYSFRDGTWKVFNTPHFEYEEQNGAFLNGHIYWLGIWDNLCKAAVMDFDLENEVLRRIPHYFDYDCISMRQLAVMGELLWIIDEWNNFWVMEECDDGESWSWTNWGVEGSGLWTDSTVFDDPYFFTMGERTKKPLCFSGQDEIVWWICRRLALYNFKDETLKKIVVRGIQGSYYPQATYTETLVSLNNFTAARRG